jgi:hypothetical protein
MARGVPGGSRVGYKLTPIREKVVTTRVESAKSRTRMLPHRVADAAWLDYMRCRSWLRFLGVDGRRA